jgi:hypothetical protein
LLLGLVVLVNHQHPVQMVHHPHLIQYLPPVVVEVVVDLVLQTIEDKMVVQEVVVIELVQLVLVFQVKVLMGVKEQVQVVQTVEVVVVPLKTDWQVAVMLEAQEVLDING